jgi:hypothetical protein
VTASWRREWICLHMAEGIPIGLSRSFRAQAEAAFSEYSTLCHLSYTFVFPLVRSSALVQPTFACSLPGCKITTVSQSDHQRVLHAA